MAVYAQSVRGLERNRSEINMQRKNKNNRNDIRNYTEISKSQFDSYYKKYKDNKELNFKIDENKENVVYYIWTKLLEDIGK